jgi:hypothetical protein
LTGKKRLKIAIYTLYLVDGSKSKQVRQAL